MRPEVPLPLPPKNSSIHILMGHLRCTSEKEEYIYIYIYIYIFLYAVETDLQTMEME